MPKYLLELDDAQADVLILALDAFARLHMGQMGSVIDDISRILYLAESAEGNCRLFG